MYIVTFGVCWLSLCPSRCRCFVDRLFFFFQAEDGIRDYKVTGVQTCALPISHRPRGPRWNEERHAARSRVVPRLRPPTERTGLAAPVTMKPPKFDYHAPASLDEALALLRRYGGDAKVLAGGQSLMPLLNFRLSRPAALVARRASASCGGGTSSSRPSRRASRPTRSSSRSACRRPPRGRAGHSRSSRGAMATSRSSRSPRWSSGTARGAERRASPRPAPGRCPCGSGPPRRSSSATVSPTRRSTPPPGGRRSSCRPTPTSTPRPTTAVTSRRSSPGGRSRARARSPMPDVVTVRLTVNGVAHEGRCEPRKLFVDFLREDLGLTGTHVGCEHGVCGACTILIDGEAARSCIMLAVQADGAEILTIEGLAQNGKLHPLQEAFREHHGLQCGFCTPGMLMTALDLLRTNPSPTEAEIREGISAVLCRCTGYHGIIRAVEAAARAMR